VGDPTSCAIQALSAARAFNRDIYFALAQALHFNAERGAFNVLRRFSFVWEAKERGEDWFRIHALLRRLFAERDEDETRELLRESHTALEKYYRERAKAGERAAIAEAIYHTNRLDWERGVNEWVEVFEQALQLSHYDLCGVLREVRNELQTDKLSVRGRVAQGRVSQAEGDYLSTLSRYNEARQEYEEAIAAFDAALTLAPNDVGAHNNKGSVLRSLGDLQSRQAQYPEAAKSYQNSIAAFDAALTLAPNDVGAHNNKGNVLQSLGDLQSRQAQYPEATTSYQNSIAAYDAALTLAPDLVEAHNGKGSLLATLGLLQAQSGDVAGAVRSLRAAVAEWSRSLEIAPGNRRIRERRGQLQAAIDQLDRTPEQVIAGLPPSIRDALASQDPGAFEQAFNALSPEEQQQVAAALQQLQAQQAGNAGAGDGEGEGPDLAALLERFEPLLQAIAAVAAGDAKHQNDAETTLAGLETKGWRLREAAQRIWAGERDEAALTTGLDAQNTTLVRRLLQIVGAETS